MLLQRSGMEMFWLLFEGGGQGVWDDEHVLYQGSQAETAAIQARSFLP